ncbi:MAG: nuclear transport factor 2 family protein [Candidatus Nitrosopolaris sp.]
MRILFRGDIVDRIIETMQTMETMENQQIRVALDKHWAASSAGDLEKEHDIYDDDVVVDYPQSGERIFSRHKIQALRGHHPSKPAGFTIRRIIGNGDLWITEYVIVHDERPVPTVSIMEFRDGKVIHETQYFAEPFEPPAWRARWVERVI